jgi:periplasmic divalent cation tolerance protein
MMTRKQDADPISEGEDALVVLITVASLGEAERIARRLVEDRLAACVNIVPQVRSLFIWQGKFSQEDEVLLVVKSRRARFRELTTAVKQLHSYRVPEIIALPILVGSSDYLRWVAESTEPGTTHDLA